MHRFFIEAAGDKVNLALVSQEGVGRAPIAEMEPSPVKCPHPSIKTRARARFTLVVAMRLF